LKFKEKDIICCIW